MATRVSVRRYTLLGIAALAWIVVAILFATGSISGAHTVVPPSGASPACLPAQLNGSALLPGTNVTVSPAPSSDSASEATQVSFLGTPVTAISNVAVEGSRTGYHYGHLYGYFQGDGGSFVPDKPFAAGEHVHVRALIRTGGQRRAVALEVAVQVPVVVA